MPEYGLNSSQRASMKTMDKFYPTIKGHLSPSALDNWLRSRSAFVKTYFEGEKGPETSAMTAGKQVHKLIEGGFLKVKLKYDIDEQEINYTFENGVKFLGFPDSYTKEQRRGIVFFVDYKTGKVNGWEEKLPTDIKMKATAWLVWQQTGKPKQVAGAIEFIQTTWDPESKQVVPIDDKETELIGIKYSSQELQDFTAVIERAIEDINEFYEQWKGKTDMFIDTNDVVKYIELKSKITELSTEMDEIGDRLKTQMEAGGMVNHKTAFGTFYTTARKVYEYPKELPIDESGMTLERAGEIATLVKVAQKNYELIAEPKSESTSIGFRVAKENNDNTSNNLFDA